MVQPDSPNNGNNALQRKQDEQGAVVYVPRTWPTVVTALGLAVVGGVGVSLIINLSRAITDTATAYSFIAQNILSLFVFLAVVAQACIYLGQRNLMLQQWRAMQAQLSVVKHQTDWIQLQAETATGQLGAMTNQTAAMINQTNLMTLSLEETSKSVEQNAGVLEAMRDQVRIMGVAYDPRLQITNVEVADLHAESEPIFMVSIRNIGAVDAEGVTISLRVSFGRPVESILAQKLSEPQVVTIAAGQEETYVIPWNQPIKQEHIDRLKQVPLIVSGFIKMRDADKREFCYRYHPLKNRPPGVPQFVPCDFDTRLTMVVTPATARLKVEGQVANVVQKTLKGEVSPQGTVALGHKKKQETEQDGEGDRQNPN